MKIMWTVLALIIIAGHPAGGFGLVDNSATRDTLSLPFMVLDSIGNPVDLANGDSVYLVVFYPGGTVAFKDSLAYNDASLKSYDWEDFNGGKAYTYTERVSVLDGASPVSGVYSYILYIDDNTAANLVTTISGTFQVITSPLESSLDSAGLAAVNAAKALDSLDKVIDSLYAVLDSLQNQDNWVGNIRYAHADSVLHLRGLHIRGLAGNDTALIASGYGAGDGLLTVGGSGGTGLRCLGGSVSGYGISALSQAGNGHGVYLGGIGAGDGLRIQGGVSGNGLEISSGTSTASAVSIHAGTGSGGDGVHITGDGQGSGIHCEGGATGDGLLLRGGATDGFGLKCEAQTLGHGAYFLGKGNYDGVRAEGGAGGGDFFGDITGSLSGQVGAVADSVLIDISANLNFADTMANRILEDSASYQGSGGDSLSIARWVWNTPHINHNIAGTFGDFLDTDISGLGIGTGAYTCTIVAVDSTIGQVIPGVNIHIRNIDQSALVAVAAADNLGRAVFHLDSDSFLVIASAPGYIFNGYDSLFVTAATVDTVYGRQFNAGTPSNPQLCRVYGFLYDINGLPEAGAVVEAWLPAGAVRNGGTIVSPYGRTAVSDSIGYFYMDLIPNAALNPPGTRYEITITRTNGNILRERITIPDTTAWPLVW